MTSTAYSQVMGLIGQLTDAEQLTVMCTLIQGGPEAGLRSDDFIDALIPVDQALSDAFAALDYASDPNARWYA